MRRPPSLLRPALVAACLTGACTTDLYASSLGKVPEGEGPLDTELVGDSQRPLDSDPPLDSEPDDSPEPTTDSEPDDSPEPPLDSEPSDSPEPPLDSEPSDSPEPPLDSEPSDSPEPDSEPQLANPCGPPVITPYYTGGAFGGFQSVPGSGYQVTITVTLPCPAERVEVTILDPDFPDNLLIAYAQGVEVGRTGFNHDLMPGVFTRDTQTLAAPGITSLELVPDPADYIAYDLVLYY
jgi:hypothetical protein